jgi:hypothetical protein
MHGIYGLTDLNIPVSCIDGRSIEYRAPGHLASHQGSAGFETVTRFEFLAHLAARSDSRHGRVGAVAVAVRGFAGGNGWAFRRTLSGPRPDGIVRAATHGEHDAVEFGSCTPIAQAEFADAVCFGRDDE